MKYKDDLEEVFRTAYARHGMSYKPLENDYYEQDERGN